MLPTEKWSETFLFIYQFDRLQTCLAQGSMHQSLECTSITANLVKKKKMQIPKPKWKNSKLADLYWGPEFCPFYKHHRKMWVGGPDNPHKTRSLE